MKQKQLIASRAAIIKDNKVLVIRESSKYEEGTQKGGYDFPGGRTDFGESIQEALKREVREETGLDVKVGQPFFVGEWKPMVKDVEFHIIAIFFICRTDSTDIVLSDDHDDYQWIGSTEADFKLIPPIPEAIQTLFNIGELKTN